MMETYSLEDDDYRDPFITQTSKDDVGNVHNEEEPMEEDNNLFLGVDPGDFNSPMKSLVMAGVGSNDYLDISDWEETEASMSNTDENMR